MGDFTPSAEVQSVYSTAPQPTWPCILNDPQIQIFFSEAYFAHSSNFQRDLFDP